MSFVWLIIVIFGLLQASARVYDPPSQPVLAVPPSEKPAFPVAIDLDSIRTRDTLRVITRNTATTYFLYRGGERGFEYELASEFASRLGVHLQMVVPPSWDDMIPWLLEGKGDIVAPGFLMTPPYTVNAMRSRPYDASYLVVVSRTRKDMVRSLDGLAGRTVHVREKSPAAYALADLNAKLNGKITVVTVPSTWDTETLLSELADGNISTTVAPWPLAQIEQGEHPDLRIGPVLGQPDSVAWFVRPDSPELLRRINEFFSGTHKSAFYNVLKEKYFAPTERYSRYKDAHVNFIRYGRISPYDAFIQRSARRAGLDWLLIAAQVYQESGFNPRAQSWMGAVGLMQLMPGTVALLGVRNPWNPWQNIQAGVRHLAAQIARFDTLASDDAIAFGLASYNAGSGHLQDARQIALEEGLNPDRWAGNVEVAVKLLSHERYYSRTLYGYCRGSETVNYVNGIMRRWKVYRSLLERPRRSPIL